MWPGAVLTITLVRGADECSVGRAASTVLGATNRRCQNEFGARLPVILHIHLVQADDHLALAVSDARHLNREAIVSNAKLFARRK